ncbi:hypothetical protein IB237_23900 [Agrobacterium sp. AGB01]|uniref:hypothetical protein n=1 Tax=Agrobacterium sp. AGB01 TaxID=2769302 RepID=UPI00177FD562|nr:hypothetical protein [Agrobacterium sp. AGB01]MBD9390248.1 hypothetical protein [Agrobacterium sp. AGB01]
MTTGFFGLLTQRPSIEGYGPHHHWQGRSGQWHITTVYPLWGNHVDLPSVYILVRRDSDGLTHPLYIGQTSDTARRLQEHLYDKILRAAHLGVNELHLHFLAKSEADRISIETDLRNGHCTPLNKQSSSAMSGGLLGLGSLM